ncbi:MAG: DUF4360 domain-containing protein [Oligoflexia bacterium]|nr:DUF4360 domain-containing protein [Oligoflexia bacterium]
MYILFEKLICLFFLIFFINVNVLAVENHFKFGSKTVVGGSCKNLVNVKVTEDGKAFELIFNKWTINGSGSLLRKNCEIAVPVAIPVGKEIYFSATDVVWKGTVALSATSTAREEIIWDSEYFFGAEGPGEKFERRWTGIDSDGKDILWEETHPLSKSKWSLCGKDSIIRIHLGVVYRKKMIGAKEKEVKQKINKIGHLTIGNNEPIIFKFGERNCQ